MPPRESNTHAAPHVEIDARMREEIARRKPSAKEKSRAALIAEALREEFPGAFCALKFSNPFELLVATILSAQCTDQRVNMVTPGLFKKYRGPADFAASPPGELEQDIRSTGFFNNKAKAIREASRAICEVFGGKVPHRMEELLTLRGTARKTANVVRMHGFGLPGISVDTHVSRIMQRLKLTKETDPEKIEFDIGALLPPEHWTQFADTVILHGRKTCAARAPKCDACCISKLCPSAEKINGAASGNSKPKKAAR